MDTRRYFLSIAFLVVIASIFVKLHTSRNTTFCYTSIATLSDTPRDANCFLVNEHGIFSKVYYLDDASAQKYKRVGHVLPGLWDGHGHLLQYGEMLESINLFGAKSLHDARKRVVKYARENPDEGTRDQWIRGIGWDQASFEGHMPTAADLNGEELKGKFIMLDRVDIHCIWVSQAVLELLPDPLPSIPGGEIVREPGLGVFCDSAMDFVRQYWPSTKPEKKLRFLRAGAKELNKFGLVGIHDASIIPSDLKLLEQAVGDKDWSLRVYGMLECEKRNTFCPEAASRIERPDGFLTIRSVKLFADGALGSWGSAMIEPYSDRPSTSGSLLLNATDLTHLAESWAALGYQVNIHAIGDLANRLTISALSSALRSTCPDMTLAECQVLRRFRIEHAQIVHADDQKRMHSIGIIPSIQPTHATSDMAYAETRLGKLRTLTEAYHARSFLSLNPILGSDVPVEPPDPWQGMYAAVARKSPHTGLGAGGSKEGWHTEEALTLSQAVRGFTTGPAYGAFLEGKAGVIEPGSYADWVVLDEAVEDMNVEGLRTLKVKETWVAGKRVYKRDE